MKKYKLLKDLPFAKAGEIVEIWSDGTIVFDDTPSLVRFNKKDVRLFPHWFEEIKSLEHFFMISFLDNKIIRSKFKFYNEQAIENLKSLGNYFETEQEAKKHLEWLKARAILLEDTKGFKPDWTDDNQLKYNVYYDYSLKSLNWYSFYDITDKQLYFKTKEDVKISIKNHEKEWKIYLGIE